MLIRVLHIGLLFLKMRFQPLKMIKGIVSYTAVSIAGSFFILHPMLIIADWSVWYFAVREIMDLQWLLNTIVMIGLAGGPLILIFAYLILYQVKTEFEMVALNFSKG